MGAQINNISTYNFQYLTNQTFLAGSLQIAPMETSPEILTGNEPTGSQAEISALNLFCHRQITGSHPADFHQMWRNTSWSPDFSRRRFSSNFLSKSTNPHSKFLFAIQCHRHIMWSHPAGFRTTWTNSSWYPSKNPPQCQPRIQHIGFKSSCQLICSQNPSHRPTMGSYPADFRPTWNNTRWSTTHWRE